jgi:hypothetical protein
MSIIKIPKTKPAYILLILLSNLLLFVGFAFQPDGTMGPPNDQHGSDIAPIIFRSIYISDSDWFLILYAISFASFLVLPVMWIFLNELSKNQLRKEEPKMEKPA